MACENDIAQPKASDKRFQHRTLRTVSGNDQLDIGQAVHRVQKVINTFFSGKSPEIQNRGSGSGVRHSLRGTILEVWQYFNSLVRPAIAVFHQFLLGELARGENQIYALLVG